MAEGKVEPLVHWLVCDQERLRLVFLYSRAPTSCPEERRTSDGKYVNRTKIRTRIVYINSLIKR